MRAYNGVIDCAMARRAPSRRSTPPGRSAGAEFNRRAVLDAASRLLVELGPDALSMRRIASEVGTSTMVLYTSFENKEGLVSALMAEGFARFARELSSVRGGSAWERLGELGRAYRRFALENPSYYRLMWSGSTELRSGAKSSESLLHGQQAFLSLQRAVTDVLVLLDRPAKDILPASFYVWSSVHGFVSLELAGALQGPPEPALAYEGLLAFIAQGLGGGVRLR